MVFAIPGQIVAVSWATSWANHEDWPDDPRKRRGCQYPGPASDESALVCCRQTCCSKLWITLANVSMQMAALCARRHT